MMTTYRLAKDLHKEYFGSHFESIPIQRLGLFHILQGRWADGIGKRLAEFGCWHGILSTDGSRVVVSILDADTLEELPATFVFENECVEQCFDRAEVWNRSRCAYIAFSRAMPGLTLTRIEAFLCLLTGMLGLGLVQGFLRRRCFYFQSEPHFGSLSTISRMLIASR